MQAYLEAIDTEVGPITFAVDGDGALLWVEFGDGDYLRTIEEQLAAEGYTLTRDSERTARARRELEEYARGERTKFEIPVVLRGTPWQVTVWQALMRIPYGETRTYGELAREVGKSPAAARAVGRANATNRIPVVVPCHRVIGADGSLTGFAGGTHLKERLLDHERRVHRTAT